MCPFDYTAFVVNGKVGDPVNRLNHISWEAVVSQTDRPKSVCSRCIIDIFGGILVLTCCFLIFLRM